MCFKNALLSAALHLGAALWASAFGNLAPVPHRLQGILEVDPDSGAATLCFPLGPGIGHPGLQYVPTLLGRFAPRIASPSAGPASPGSRVAASTFEFSPGSLAWARASDGGAAFSEEIHWTYPDGTGGRAKALDGSTLDATGMLARFGFSPVAGDHGALLCARFAGDAGEDLLIPLDTSKGEASSAALSGDGALVHGPGRTAPIVRVIRNDLAYEYRFAGSHRCDRSAYYRLIEVRGASGDRMTFTYGLNGLDFEAAWRDAKLCVSIEGVEEVAAVPALDSGPPAPDPGTSCRLEARLLIRYGGSLAGTPGYVLGLLLKAQDAALGGAIEEPFPESGTSPRAMPPALPQTLQVSRVVDESSGDSVEFTYAKAPDPGICGSRQASRDNPTVLESIVFPRKSFLLEWAPEDRKETVPAFGIKAVHETDAQTYWRQPAPSIQGWPGVAPRCTTPEMPARCAMPGWTRQSRHFAFASTRGDPDRACATYVRDRRRLVNAPPDPDSDGGECDIPTFRWDAADGVLVPVPGCLTRRLDWTPGSDAPPDIHTAGRGPRRAEGLKGGNLAGEPGDPIWFKRPVYDPSKHEVTLEAVAGGPPLPNGPTPFRGQPSLDLSTGELKPWRAQTAEGVLQRSIEDSSRPIPMPGHEAQVAGLEAQAEFYHRQAMSQMAPGPNLSMPSAPHDPALGLDVLTRLGASHEGTAGILQDPSLSGGKTLHEIDETLARAGQIQGRTAEVQRQSDESLRKLLEARRLRRVEAQRRAAEAGIDLDELTRELRGPEEPAPAEGGGALKKAWGAIRKAGESISEFLQRNSNQAMGLGRITDQEVPEAMEKLALTDPRKYNRIIFLWKIMDLPLISCGGLFPVGSGPGRMIEIGNQKLVPDPGRGLGPAGEPGFLLRALENAKPIGDHPNQLMATFEDGTRVIFRKDFGARAHKVGGPFEGMGKIDHYNVQIQVPEPNGRIVTIENIHIVPDGKGGYLWWGKK